MQISPRRAGPGNPKNRFDKAAVILAAATRIAGLARNQRRNPLPLPIGHGAKRHKTSGFGLYRVITSGGEVICALGWAELGQERADLVPELFDVSLGGFAQEGLELGEGVFLPG
jgi:hypothetical protein